jgi:hypothetical protein
VLGWSAVVSAPIKVRRSTVGEVEQTVTVYDAAAGTEREVPSYVVLYGSLNDAAKSMGFRLLGRRESGDVVAEFHERGVSGSWWAVLS